MKISNKLTMFETEVYQLAIGPGLSEYEILLTKMIKDSGENFCVKRYAAFSGRKPSLLFVAHPVVHYHTYWRMSSCASFVGFLSGRRMNALFDVVVSTDADIVMCIEDLPNVFNSFLRSIKGANFVEVDLVLPKRHYSDQAVAKAVSVEPQFCHTFDYY